MFVLNGTIEWKWSLLDLFFLLDDFGLLSGAILDKVEGRISTEGLDQNDFLLFRSSYSYIFQRILT